MAATLGLYMASMNQGAVNDLRARLNQFAALAGYAAARADGITEGAFPRMLQDMGDQVITPEAATIFQRLITGEYIPPDVDEVFATKDAEQARRLLAFLQPYPGVFEKLSYFLGPIAHAGAPAQIQG